MIIDTFTTGDLGAATDAARGGSPHAAITSLTVSGAVMDDADFAFIRNNLSAL